MIDKIVLATTNRGKIAEMNKLLSNKNICCISRDELGISVEISETGNSYYENAKLKAEAIAKLSGLPSVADDSGLEVFSLSGEPGLFSSSYGGESLTDEERCSHLLKELRDISDRGAKFVCCIVCVFPDGKIIHTTGECFGNISDSAKGSFGFGYDSVFIPQGSDKTFAEIDTHQKQQISHRGKALSAFVDLLGEYNDTTTSSNKQRVGIFGGTFDPPHKGHVHVISKAVKDNNLDLVIVIPTGVPPHKALPECTAKAEDRLIMTKNAFSGFPNALVSEIEIHSKSKNYFIDTLSIIAPEYPGSEIYLLLGADMCESLRSWKDSEKILRHVTPISISREDVNISSTDLREMLQNRDGLSFICDENYSYIISKRLYNSKPDWDWLRDKSFSMHDDSRISHVKSCELEAEKLAKKWDVNVDDAREAAILHDITKRLDFAENMCIITKSNNYLPNSNISYEKLLHAISGAILAKRLFGVSDEVAGAIRWHTTGRADMTMLEKVIYIADYTEETRDFDGVDKLRKLAYSDIDKAVLYGLSLSVDELILRGITPSSETYEAINSLTGKEKDI